MGLTFPPGSMGWNQKDVVWEGNDTNLNLQ